MCKTLDFSRIDVADTPKCSGDLTIESQLNNQDKNFD